MKVGDYVRTNEGIRKIEEIDKQYIITDLSFNEYSSNLNDRKDLENNIIKSTPNIIDLIEVGDYVNGFKVVWKDINKKEFSIHSYYASENIINNSKKIKSILTREQFESMEYRIGE